MPQPWHCSSFHHARGRRFLKWCGYGVWKDNNGSGEVLLQTSKRPHPNLASRCSAKWPRIYIANGVYIRNQTHRLDMLNRESLSRSPRLSNPSQSNPNQAKVRPPGYPQRYSRSLSMTGRSHRLIGQRPQQRDQDVLNVIVYVKHGVLVIWLGIKLLWLWKGLGVRLLGLRNKSCPVMLGLGHRCWLELLGFGSRFCP